MWFILLVVLAFLIPYNTGAIIHLYNSERYTIRQRRNWLFKILFLPFYGAYQYNKQRDHETMMQDSVEAASQVLTDVKSEALDDIWD
ncbi:Uncharacterised protein [BD1-7 clade bacterium]|uniref:Uncharacterized protein n=1 Tax=BD1-7 clade bacterium TaxID=2029982 RepID=A0A5S9Q7U3_9GAMM|nr:Uncharacterised protein [BD1-7 clade bacterium]